MHTSYVENLFNSQDTDFIEESHIISESSAKDLKNREKMQKELENVLELRITEALDSGVENNDAIVEIIKEEEPEKIVQNLEEQPVTEDKKEEDDSSIVTSATINSQSVTNIDEPAQEPKKKRVYKPRKKKGDPVL